MDKQMTLRERLAELALYISESFGHDQVIAERTLGVFVDDNLPAILEALEDAERYRWYFNSTDKSAFIPAYLKGVQEGWTLDEWRAAIDKERVSSV